jgi:glycosyltransferase involved in cell wall biosynthesis
MRDKYTIFYDWHLDIRAGGPTGYLANLQEGLKLTKTKSNLEIEIVSKEVPEVNNSSTTKKNKYTIIKRLRKFLRKNYSKKGKARVTNFVKFLDNYNDIKIDQEMIKKVDFKNSKYIHAHTFIDAVKVINTLKELGKRDEIKVILTSHCPESPAIEEYNNYLELGYTPKTLKPFKAAWDRFIERAIKDLDIFVFPSKEAMEPYFDTIENFKDLIKDKDVRFAPTGAKQLATNLTKEQARSQYNIPEGKKVVTYIGRHIEVKGYDLLVQAGKQVLSKRDDVIFLIGGKPSGSIKQLEHKNWVELGWINPAELLKATDVFALPNKRTYFDLIVLEILSTGTPLIATNTGGNKSVQKETNALIMTEPNANSIANSILEFLDKDEKEIEEISVKLLKSYEDKYTIECFADNIINVINSFQK